MAGDQLKLLSFDELCAIADKFKIDVQNDRRGTCLARPCCPLRMSVIKKGAAIYRFKLN